MLSGAELNQLLMPAKSGAVPCAAATLNGAAWSRAIWPAMPELAAPTRHNAMTEAEEARKRIVMEVSLGRDGLQADLAIRVESCQPRHDQRVVLKIRRDRECDHDDAKPLLQPWGNSRDTANAGGDGLSSIC